MSIRSTVKFALSEAVKSIIETKLSRVTTSPYKARFFEAVSRYAREVLETNLPCEFISKYQDVASGKISALEIRNVPEEVSLPSTPTSLDEVMITKTSYVKEAFCLGLAEIIDLKIFNYRQEAWGTGMPIFNVFPKRDLLGIKGAGGVEDDFRMHCENAWHPRPIEMLFLTGIRPDSQRKARTYVASNQDILEKISAAEKRILSMNSFKVSPPEIHSKMEKEHGIIFAYDKDYVGPILTFSEDGIPFLRANFNGMEPLYDDEPESITALRSVEKAATEVRQEIELHESNMVIINNRAALHTRNGYEPLFDGKDRWFQRYFLTHEETLWQNQPLLNTDFIHICDESTSNLIMSFLEVNNIIDSQGFLLSNSFIDTSFDISIPKQLTTIKYEIIKIILKKGPIKPERRI